MRRRGFLIFSAFPLLLPMAGAPVAAQAPALTNVALKASGARVSLTTSPTASRDPQTPPEATFDGDIHSRCVLRGGTPYTFTIELLDRMPIEKIAFSHSDYASERAPKDVEIVLDDGTTLKQTLELKRPERRRPAWQEVPVGKTAKVVKVTVLSNHEPSEKVNWGGLGEIAVWTSADLKARLAAPGYDANAPTFVHAPSLAASAAPTVTLPPQAAPGEHPRLLLTKREVAELKAALATERGKGPLEAMVKVADGAAASAPDFPDPKGPMAQMTDRGDAVAKRHDRISLNAGSLGIAYALTGDAKYAKAAAEILKGYAARYADYAEHKGVNRSDTGKVMGQRLSEAMWLIPLIQAYDYIYDSGALTADDKKAIEEKLIRAAVVFIRRKDPATDAAERDRSNPDWRTAPPKKAGAANWLLYYNAATMMAGSVMDDRSYMDIAAADFRSLLANGIGEDGMWEEGAIGYQFFALTSLVSGVEAAARRGIDLWSFDNARLKRLFDSPLRYAYPDGSAPGINDSGRTRFGDWSTMVYDYAYLRYGDPAYLPLIASSPRQLHMSQAVYFPTRIYAPPAMAAATSAGFGSTLFGDLGYAIVRRPGLYALMDYGPHGGVHGHQDKLNLILFAGDGAKGDEMGGEPRFHRYEDPLHGSWTVQTVAHNTLAVDESSQTATTGRLLVFEDTPDLKVMRAQAAGAYPGALLDRTVVATPEAVLDIFSGRSGYARTWDRTLRFQGKLRGLSETAEAVPLGARDGYQNLKVAARQPADQPWNATWETTVGEWSASLAGAPGQEVILARGPDDDQLALARHKGERADFAVAYGSVLWPAPSPTVRAVATGSPDVTAYEMAHRQGTTTVYVAHAPGAWQAQGWKSDARVLAIRRQGADTQVLLTGGTFAEGPDGSLRRPAAGNYLARRQGDRLDVVSEWAAPAAAPATTAAK